MKDKLWGAEMEALLSRGSAGPPDTIPPFGESLRAGKNTKTYRAHSYHTKVPPEAIERLIRHHTSDADIIIDPFCGSGMTGVAALTTGRNAVLSDLSPAAVHIATNYTTPCDPNALISAFNRVAEDIGPTIASLYECGTGKNRVRVEYTVWSDIFECPNCGDRIVYWVGGRNQKTGAVNDEVRCSSCRRASDKRQLKWVGEAPVETNARTVSGREAHCPTRAELGLIKHAAALKLSHWIPDVPFDASREMWRAGHTASGIKSVADFYTKRNLLALSTISHSIRTERDARIRSALMFAFTAMVNRASKRYQWNVKRPTNVMTGTLYVSSLRYEWNVWSLFERKMRDVVRYFEQLGRPSARAFVTEASATDLAHLPDQSADYVFMDPPFGANIFYADSSLLWDAWLGALTDQSREIVVNKHRLSADGGKTLADYQRLMTGAFSEVARVLKPSAYATLQFNNSDADVWCAIQDAIRDAGLEVRHAVGLDKIHPSIKGVKGRQAKEDVASLDALIELRRSTQIRSTTRRQASIEELRRALRAFAVARAAPFSTDDAFANLVQSTLSSDSSMTGISIQTVKTLCGELFRSAGTNWVAQADASPLFESIGSPHGCVAANYLASDDAVSQLCDPKRAAPSVDGVPPRAVPGQRNTAFYNAHSYHTKVPPEAITPFLNHFTRPGDVVLDPFCGSGMTGVAAELCERRAVLSDLSVAAAHLAFNHTRPCDPSSLVKAFDEISSELGPEFRDIYGASDGGYVHYTLWSRDAICTHCDHRFPIWDVINRETGRMPAEVACPSCRTRAPKHSLRYEGNRPVLLSVEDASGHRIERAPVEEDLARIAQFTRDDIADWYPRTLVDTSREMFIRSALHLQGIKTVADFYTPRNLRALARLWARIQAVPHDRVRAALAFAFTNTAWHGTRMRRFNARGGQRPLTGTLYVPQLSSEANVLEVMRNKIRQLHSYYAALGQPSVPVPAIRLGSATHLEGIQDHTIDYVFTDPPFGSNIFYSDCNLIWESWLGGLTREEKEAVVNRSRPVGSGGKTVEDYQRLMTESLQEIHRVLKPGAWATLVFHNTDPAVWSAIQSAAEMAGFRIEDAAGLERKQQSHKGYKGRSELEDVAHFDVIMSMRKDTAKHQRKQRPAAPDVRQLVIDAFKSLSPSSRTVQRVHSEVIQRLAREGRDLGSVSFRAVKENMPRKAGVQQLLFE